MQRSTQELTETGPAASLGVSDPSGEVEVQVQLSDCLAVRDRWNVIPVIVSDAAQAPTLGPRSMQEVCRSKRFWHKIKA
jgi:hypothetical protein